MSDRPCDFAARAKALEKLREAVAELRANPWPHKPEVWVNPTAGNTLWIGTEPIVSHDVVDVIALLIPYIEAEQAELQQKNRMMVSLWHWLGAIIERTKQ